MFGLKALGIVAGLVGAVVGSTGAARAQAYASLPQVARPAVSRGDARTLAGWAAFCNREPAECAFGTDEPTTITLTPRIWSTIVSVNRRVNASLTPMTDEEHWGVADRWDIPTDGIGDCEDFQLLKRRTLAAEGLPRRAMRMTVVIDERGDGHAVLMIRTNRGDFILDNKSNLVLPWFETGYTFVKRESQDALAWVSLGGATSPTVTANP